MDSRYTIGELARAAGIPPSTVRYYERAGLLRPDGRTAANYRLYGDRSLERLRFIRAAQANGFKLDDIVRLLDFRDGATEPCREVQTLIEARLDDLKGRVRELQELQTVLQTSLRACRRSMKSGRCRVIQALSKPSDTRRPGGRPPTSAGKP